MKLFSPETQGKTPPPRFGHSMVHIPDLNIIVISGGRNDVGANTDSYLGCYKDIHILHLERLRWLQVTYGGVEKSPRFSHVAGCFGTRMVVFGGLNFETYIPSELEITELDQENSAKMQVDQVDIRKKKRVVLPGLYNNNSLPDKNNIEEKIQTEDDANLKKFKKSILTYLPIPKKEDLHIAYRPNEPNQASQNEDNNKSSNRRSASVPDKRPPFKF